MERSGTTPIDEPADVVVATHTHDDHGATDTIPGDPLVFVHPAAETVGSLQITGVEVAHDEAGGSKRGRNTIVILDDGDVRLVHLGDLGHTLDAATVQAIGRVDVLLVPVGGFFTIDHDQAAAVVEALDPRIVIPIHYKTDKAGFPDRSGRAVPGDAGNGGARRRTLAGSHQGHPADRARDHRARARPLEPR